MGRPKKQNREPFWRSDRSCYYVQQGTRQRRLSPDKDEAWRMWHELMAKPPEERAAAPLVSADPLVVEILDAFLTWAEANSSPKTFKWRKENLQAFTSSIPKGLMVSELKPFHVTREMNAHPTWGGDTRANFARCVQRAFRWALDQGLIDKNPIPKVEKPGKGRREEFYTREEYERLLDLFPDQEFHDVLVTAWETGCRPQEIFAVEALHVDHEGKRWVFTVKSSKGKRKPRIVYLSDLAYEVTERLCRAHPTGKLFRNQASAPWDKNTVSRRFLRKKKRLGKKYCLYSFRHSFAQRKLLEGVDPITVATLLGHSNLSMLANQYSHLMKDAGHLRKAINPSSSAGASGG